MTSQAQHKEKDRCVYEDQPIYRKSFFTTNLKEQDEFITHTNGDEIREALAMRSDNSDIAKVAAKSTKKVVEAPVDETVTEEVEEDENVTFDF